MYRLIHRLFRRRHRTSHDQPDGGRRARLTPAREPGPAHRGTTRPDPAGFARASSGPAFLDLAENLRARFREADDVVFRRFRLGDAAAGTVIYIAGLVESDRVEQAVIEPLVRWGREMHPEPPGETAGPGGWAAEPGTDVPELSGSALDLAEIAERVLTAAQVSEARTWEAACAAVLSGDVLVAFDGCERAVVVSNRGAKARGVDEPLLEVTIRGPKDSFTETLQWNIALVRRRIRDPHLCVSIVEVGRRSRTQVALLYIEGVAPESLVQEVKSRLARVDIDGVLDTGYIEHLIEDSWWSPFPQHIKTERPDKVVAALLEGRAALIAEGTPFVLMMPATLDALFHSPEDSYDRWLPVNFLRAVRFIASVLCVSLPALYIALVAYHPGILPTQFLLRAAAAREGVAFPVVVEALLMQFFLELIKEAGFRVPSPIGQTFGIVGGITLGQVGVQAGIVSEAMVIVVSATAISSFAAIDRELGTVLRLLGLPVMLFSAVLGLPGLVMALTLIGIHLTTLRSYGVPYMAPYPYYRWRDLADTLVKAPMQAMQERPVHLVQDELTRLRVRGEKKRTRGRRRREEREDADA